MSNNSNCNYTANNSQNDNQKYSVKNAFLNYYFALMFTVFPLFATNAYFNIRHDKYYFFIILTTITVVVEAMLIYSAYSEKKKSNTISSDKHLQNDISVSWYQTLSFTDWAMLALLFFCILSTALSDTPIDALLGTMGRNNGLLLIALYVGIYFVVTRCFKFMEYIFLAFAGTSILVFLLAILNCFYIDPLGMFANLADEQTINDFTSTIGNKNLLSSYICIALPVFITLSVHTKKVLYRVLYYAASAFGFCALMTADSDSGILGIAAIVVVLFIWYSRRISRLKYYFLNLFIMLSSTKLLRLFSLAFSDKSKGMDDFQEFFVYSPKSFVLIAVVAVIALALFLIDHKKPNYILPKAVPITLIILSLLACISIVLLILYFSIYDTKTTLGSVERFLRIDDKWGTHRGFMWIRSMWIFNDSSIAQKLFGSGPDTFYYSFQPYFSDLQKFGDSSTNAAHNEYINYLITIGVAGLISYLAVLFSSIARCIKSAVKNPLAIICASAVICYAVQAVVNIAQPITTPLFFLFLALGEAVSRQVKNGNIDSFK